MVKNRTPNVPRLIGVDRNPGFANDEVYTQGVAKDHVRQY